MIEEFEKFEVKKPEYKIEVIKKLDRETLEQILEVEKASFPEQMQSDLEDLKETLENKKGVQIVVRNEKGEIISYLTSKPLKDAYEELKYYDPELKPEEGVIYVESIATKPTERSVQLFFELLKTFKEEARKKGYKKIACHARISNNLSSFLQRRGAKKLRTIENWHNFGEPFDYLEIEIE
jgi:ribosomal protein S18 acetylase RimI-like enzyme